MTNLITLTIPNDDTVALRQFGKALIEIASEKDGHPVDVTVTPLVISTDVKERLRVATEELQQAAPHMMQELRFEGEELHGKRKEPEVDTTAQQVESLAANVVDREVHFDNPEPTTTDSTGTPWDERIHSTSKALNADGTWRLRRKPKDMDEEQWSVFIQNVQDELLGQKPDDNRQVIDEAVVKPDTLCESEPPVTPPGDDYQTDTSVVTEQTVAGIPPLPVPPPVVVAPPVPVQAALSEGIARYGDAMSELAKNDGDVRWDFPRLMTFLTERHGKIDVATVNTLLAQDGMSSVQELNAHPDKIGPFVARVKAHLGE